MNEVLSKDIDFGFDKIYIWDSKSLSDRTVPLPLKLKDELKVQELLGHKSVETTMAYTHVVAEMNKGKVASPLDMR